MQTPLSKNKEKRKSRVKQTAEIFTPNSLVNQMLDSLPKEVWKEDKENTFIDFSCGNGNFLIYILWRKLSLEHNVTEALRTIYGVDIKKDNIRECRLRLLKIISLFEEVTKEHVRIVTINVRFLNCAKWPRGSLDYNMSFRNNCNAEDIDRWYKEIQNGELNLVDLPVSDDDIGPSIADGKVAKANTESFIMD